MKKILIILAILILGYVLIKEKENYYVIPDEAIRFRIIANSDSIYDQYIKMKVKNNLEESFKKDISLSTTIEDTRNIIESNIETYKTIVNNVFKQENYDKDFKINYGMNYFPEKIYDGVKYEEGEYESLLITIGEGKGDNWWCVLFPPICTLEVTESDNIEYSFYIKEIMEKYLK